MSTLLNKAPAANALSAAEFRALVRLKGHSLASLARLWGLTRARLSQIAADPARAPHYAFALLGTPRARARTRPAAPAAPAARAATTGLSGRVCLPDVEPGEVFVVRDSPGEHLPEGEEGVVTAVTCLRGSWLVQLRFTNADYEERYELPYLLSADCFLARTGRLQRL